MSLKMWRQCLVVSTFNFYIRQDLSECSDHANTVRTLYGKIAAESRKQGRLSPLRPGRRLPPSLVWGVVHPPPSLISDLRPPQYQTLYYCCYSLTHRAQYSGDPENCFMFGSRHARWLSSECMVGLLLYPQVWGSIVSSPSGAPATNAFWTFCTQFYAILRVF